MPAPTSPSRPPILHRLFTPDRGARWLVAGLLALALLAAYANSLGGPFVFDDIPSISNNPTIRQLWPLSVPLSPPSGLALTVCGRPLLNLSLALNYAVGGLDPRGYHAVNLLIHLAAALTVFGLARRTAPHWRAGISERESTFLAGAIAALWALHPLLTESVTYTVQRAESLTGLFTLLALYGLARGADSARPRSWQALAVLATFAAVATKEIGVIVPVLAVLYDRTFLAGSWRAAWRERGRLHLVLFSSWLLLGWLSFAEGDRGGTAVLGAVERWAYWRTQFGAVAHYLRLVVWPHPLIFEYGYRLAPSFAAVLPQALLVGALGAVTLVGLWRHTAAGFLGCWFFLGLAPASLTPNTVQVIVEHRMYLPLLAPVALAAGWAFRCGGVRWLAPFAALSLVGAGLTAARNRDYRTELALWSDTVAKSPGGARAWGSLGAIWYLHGEFEKALECSQRAAAIDPLLPEPHMNLGLACVALGRDAEAVEHFTAGLRLNPHYTVAQTQLAFCLVRLGRESEAVAPLRQALELDPGDPQKLELLASLLEKRGHLDEACAVFDRATLLAPNRLELRLAYGLALVQAQHLPAARVQFAAAVAAHPRSTQAHTNLGIVLAELGQLEDAREQYLAAIAQEPANAFAHYNLARTLLRLNRLPEARDEFAAAVRLDPTLPGARKVLDEMEQVLGPAH